MPSVESNNEHPGAEELRAEVAPPGSEESRQDDEEFAVAIRKLDRVVRPRGVLADG